MCYYCQVETHLFFNRFFRRGGLRNACRPAPAIYICGLCPAPTRTTVLAPSVTRRWATAPKNMLFLEAGGKSLFASEICQGQKCLRHSLIFCKQKMICFILD